MADAEQTTVASRRQTLVGIVTSTFGDKTIRVVVERLVRHPQYGKILRRRTKVAAHDPSNKAKVGDTVEITACRRISKTKNHRLVSVLKSAAGAGDAAVQG